MRRAAAGSTLGGAQVSEKHCNFLINLGNATSTEIEALGEEVRRRVEDAVQHPSRMGNSARRAAMNKNLHVVVLMGGWSTEREVSLTSGKGVAEALRAARLDATSPSSTWTATSLPDSPS